MKEHLIADQAVEPNYLESKDNLFSVRELSVI
jgi:hypothetical protein